MNKLYLSHSELRLLRICLAKFLWSVHFSLLPNFDFTYLLQFYNAINKFCRKYDATTSFTVELYFDFAQLLSIV